MRTFCTVCGGKTDRDFSCPKGCEKAWSNNTYKELLKSCGFRIVEKRIFQVITADGLVLASGDRHDDLIKTAGASMQAIKATMQLTLQAKQE